MREFTMFVDIESGRVAVTERRLKARTATFAYSDDCVYYWQSVPGTCPKLGERVEFMNEHIMSRGDKVSRYRFPSGKRRKRYPSKKQREMMTRMERLI